MYHVSNDKRAQRSAELLWEGLEKCLRKKELHEIRVVDINRESYVSRATFYRLFDRVQDILAWRCSRIFHEFAEEIEDKNFHSVSAAFTALIRMWVKEKTLAAALAKNQLTGLIYDAQIKNTGLLKKLFLSDTKLSEDDMDYLLSMLAELIPAALQVWYAHGCTESPEEIYQSASKSLRIIADAVNG
jgi:AcrR family transcriptional regulator